MRTYLKRASIVPMLYATTVVLVGCLDFMGGKVEDTTAVAPDSGPSNNPPTISGNPPPAVKVGDNYSFVPTASDPDAGDTLSFSIQNKPMWADFHTSTGALSGVAVLGSVGLYANIQVTVSDGSLVTSLPEFSVNVVNVGNLSATLSWTAPTQNTDSSALVGLKAYKIYYGKSEGSYSNQIYIDNPGIASYKVNDLTPNRYFFVVTAVNDMDVESGYSNAAMLDIR